MHSDLVYEFTLRQGVTFHNGDPFTAEDGQFSFKGAPERSTRLAMLKTGEADIAYLMIGDEGAAIKAAHA